MLSRSNIEQIARQEGFVQRDSKIDGLRFVDALMFANLANTSTSLNDLSAYLLDEHEVLVSKQGVDERFNRQAVGFLHKLLSLQLNQQLDLPGKEKYNCHFNRIRVKDSTKWNLLDNCAEKYKGSKGCRANSNSMISLQFEYDLLNGSILDLSLTSGTRNDLADSKQTKDDIQKGDLLIRDLGYVGNAYLKNIVEKQAYFLNRLSPQVGVYFQPDRDTAVCFKKILKKLKKSNLNYIEHQVVVGSGVFIGCRMIAARVPEKIYNKRIAQASKKAKSRGYGVTDEYKARAALNIYITNVDKQIIDTSQVVDVYKSRWQIELTFKTWKSLIKISRLSKMKMVRFECQLIAKLIFILVNYNIFFAVSDYLKTIKSIQAVSMWKFFKLQLRKLMEIREIIWFSSHKKRHRWLDSLIRKTEKHAVLEQKNNKTPIDQILSIIIKPLA